jgi:hypothetical protein
MEEYRYFSDKSDLDEIKNQLNFQIQNNREL